MIDRVSDIQLLRLGLILIFSFLLIIVKLFKLKWLFARFRKKKITQQ